MNQPKAACEPTPWYHWHRFAVLPNLRIKQADQWSTWGFHFHWLFFRAWTMDCVWLGAEVELDDQQLQVRVNIPYLIMGLFIPLFPQSWGQKLWRKRKGPRP